MMKKYLFLFLCVCFSSPKALSLVSYSFSHHGFEEGASVTGNFSGLDLNKNGKLEAEFNEVFYFRMTFSGNSLVPAFSIKLADASVFDFTYDLDGENLSETDFNGVFIESNDGTLDYHGFFTPSLVGDSSSISCSDADKVCVSTTSQVMYEPAVAAEQAAAIDEMTKRADADNRFDSSIISSYGENLNWLPNWELRWLNFNFSGNRVVKIYHTINKQEPSMKYTNFKDPDSGTWSGWIEVE
jgi:hypothetical protein